MRRVVAVLWFGQFTATAGLTVVVPFLPFYLAELDTPVGEVAWWTAAGLAAPALSYMISARSGGRRDLMRTVHARKR
jgi:MFS transporter, DHA1 family, staphyloferrin B biosynthesis exporter